MKTLRPALTLLILLSIVTGLIYPLVVFGINQAIFPKQSNGSLVVKDGQVIGSELLGQNFSGNQYFWSRPSATGPMPNNGLASSGSNQGPLNPALVDVAKARIDAYRSADPKLAQQAVPQDLATASASGLDPHISPEAAYFQAGRVSKARGISLESINTLISKAIEPRQLGFLGEPRVNVLLLNLQLDQMATK